jgi:hypothetical protein
MDILWLMGMMKQCKKAYFCKKKFSFLAKITIRFKSERRIFYANILFWILKNIGIFMRNKKEYMG